MIRSPPLALLTALAVSIFALPVRGEEAPAAPAPAEAEPAPKPEATSTPATPPDHATPPEDPVIPPTPAPAPPGTPPPDPDHDRTWFDRGHRFVEQRIFAPALRFDRFFSDERELDAERAESFIRVRTQLRVRDSGGPQPGVDVRANLRLPGLNQWLERARLVIGGQSDDAGAGFGPTPTQQPGVAGQNGLNRPLAELRFGIWQGILSKIDLGAGVLLRLPPGLFARARYQTLVPVSDLFVTRFADTAYWRTDRGFGNFTALDFERPLGWDVLFRTGATADRAQRETRGFEWSSTTGVIRPFSARSAGWLAFEVRGAQHAPVQPERYRFYLRARRDIWRHWLFYELEPEIAWPWTPEKKRFREHAVTFRLEVQFQGNEAPAPR